MWNCLHLLMIYLASRFLFPEEIKDNLGRNRDPKRSGGAEHNARRAARFVGALPSDDPDVITAGGRQGGPSVHTRRADASGEARHHPLRQLQHTSPPFNTWYHCAWMSQFIFEKSNNYHMKRKKERKKKKTERIKEYRVNRRWLWWWPLK